MLLRFIFVEKNIIHF